MIAAIRTFLQDRKANASTEFAFILPVMLVLMAGIVEFGRLFQTYDAVNRLATRYASTYSDCNDTATSDPTPCKTELGIYSPIAAIQNIAPQLTNTSSINVRMFEVQISSGTPSVIYSQPSGLSWTNMLPTEQQRATAAVSAGNTQQTGVVVTVQYVHQLLFFSKLMQNIIPTNLLTFSYTVAQRKT